jgi:hypothetical protein
MIGIEGVLGDQAVSRCVGHGCNDATKYELIRVKLRFVSGQAVHMPASLAISVSMVPERHTRPSLAKIFAQTLTLHHTFHKSGPHSPLRWHRPFTSLYQRMPVSRSQQQKCRNST